MKAIEIKELPLANLDLPSKWWGSVALFNADDALVLVDFCEKNHIAVLGLEGFRLTENARTPEMNCIVDCSELSRIAGPRFQEASIASVKDFIRSLSKEDLYFEFVLVGVQ
jgi:hypothetical protein